MGALDDGVVCVGLLGVGAVSSSVVVAAGGRLYGNEL